MAPVAGETRARRANSPAGQKTAEGDKAETLRKETNGAKDKGSKADAKKAAGWLSPGFLLKVAVLGAVVYGAYSVFSDKKRVQENMEAAINFIEQQGETAIYYYLGLVLVGVVCLVPTTPIEFAGGFLFSPKYGMWQTLFMTSFVKLIANTISVFVARNFIRDWVMKTIVEKNELLSMVSKAVKEEPWKMAFLVRGSMLPLAVKNYGLGVMDIGYLQIAACSCIFTTFYAFQNIYLGSVCQNLKDVFSPKKEVTSEPGDYSGTFKALMPIAFNVLLVFFIFKAVKEQIKKSKKEIEDNLKAQSKKAE